MNLTPQDPMERELMKVQPAIPAGLRDRLIYESGVAAGRQLANRRAFGYAGAASLMLLLLVGGSWWADRVSTLSSVLSTAESKENLAPASVDFDPRAPSYAAEERSGLSSKTTSKRSANDRETIRDPGVLRVAHTTLSLLDNKVAIAWTPVTVFPADTDVLRPSSKLVW